MAFRNQWTEDQTKRALFLYFQLPFGQLHQRNREIIDLANSLGRSPSSVAMKLANFASLDPRITESGRKGLRGASALDRRVWETIDGDWTKLIHEICLQEESLILDHSRTTGAGVELVSPGGPTTARAEVQRRRGQEFFRRAVLANFNAVCCVTGISEPRLLIASHISPWSTDEKNRHNPRNGLCLSATFDRAFDQHLMTVDPGDLTIRFSSHLLNHANPETRDYFAPYEGRRLRSPTHLSLDGTLLSSHYASFMAA